MTNATTLFGGSGSSYDLPTLENTPSITPSAVYTNMYTTAGKLEGYNGDGDYVILPSSTASIEYFNSSAVSQWTVALTDVNAACDYWVGWCFSGSVIYGVAVDTDTTPNTFYTFSINSSGTVSNIGNAQPSSDIGGGNINWWGISLGSGGSTIQRAGMDTGNIYILRNVSTTAHEYMVLDISDGSVVTEPTTLELSTSTSDEPFYLVDETDNLWLSMTGMSAIASPSFRYMSLPVNQPIIEIFRGAHSDNNTQTPLQWKGYVAMTDDTSLTVDTPKFFNHNALRTYAYNLAKYHGVDLGS